jgi:HEAT repeat protein
VGKTLIIEKDMKAKHALTVAALLQQLADASQPLSVARLYALSNLDRADLARVQAAWPTLLDERRRAIIGHLVDIAETNFEANFIPVFRLALGDPNADVREAAIDGLWEDQDPTLIPVLLNILQNDVSEKVRAAGASALGQFVYLDEIEEIPHAQVEPALQALRQVLAAPSEPLEVRCRAVEALGFSSAEDVPDIIRKAYASPEELMRVSAVFAMGNSADEQWIDTIISELESQLPAMRYEAARAAGELEARTAVGTLARLLDDPDREVQEMAVWALGQIGGKRARSLLADLTAGDDADLAQVAADALEELEWMHGDRDLPLFVFDPHADEEDE